MEGTIFFAEGGEGRDLGRTGGGGVEPEAAGGSGPFDACGPEGGRLGTAPGREGGGGGADRISADGGGAELRVGGRGGSEGGFETAACGGSFFGGTLLLESDAGFVAETGPGRFFESAEDLARAVVFFFAFGEGGGELAAMAPCYPRMRPLCVLPRRMRIYVALALTDD